MSIEEIINHDNTFKYHLLDRMRTDCNYYLGNGNRLSKYLWALDEKEHIEIMKAIYNSFNEDEKPQWISLEDIKNYEKEMCANKECDKDERT